jgi:uncharacterized protein (DUF305 family)
LSRYLPAQAVKPTARKVLLAAAALLAGATAGAQEGHVHGAATPAAPQFVASTVKPFAALMEDAMAVMEDGMRRAPMNGQPEHDFVTMMVPHHQGAVDMAKALLLTTRDPALRNMAQGIVAEQQIEIQLMQQWLKAHPATTPLKAIP